jgi:hypothetical protein
MFFLAPAMVLFDEEGRNFTEVGADLVEDFLTSRQRIIAMTGRGNGGERSTEEYDGYGSLEEGDSACSEPDITDSDDWEDDYSDEEYDGEVNHQLKELSDRMTVLTLML